MLELNMQVNQENQKNKKQKTKKQQLKVKEKY